ncbi:DUF4270 domain-containing protein [Fulvivirga maritima]|uniref:DUF4270 family protein n=1 Tax=Fulvivirga maritima TaxID=2904247 RepID=UPI001F1E9EB5|nr:DUF4270 family protein [Fulvivirga maritima]UII25638.1 DUF4270 domain-containing protein [Fulvivirga maritima]
MRFFFLLLVIGFGLMISCNEESSTGAQFFNGTSFEFTSWDTLTMDFSTVKFDSITTNSPSVLLMGSYSYEDYGDISSQVYAQVSPAAAYQLDDEYMVYDSIVLVMRYNTYYLGDTTQQFNLEVAEVMEEIELDDDNSALYNTSTFKVSTDEDPAAWLASSEVKMQPFTRDSLEVRISDELGRKWFDESLESNNLFSDDDDFKNEFKGIRIKGDGGAVIGFDTQFEIKVYYTDNSVSPAEQEYMSFTNDATTDITFNHIVSDYENTPLFTTDSEDDDYMLVSSEDTDNRGFIQPGIGVFLRIDFPSLNSIIEDNPDMLLESAYLVLKPVSSQYPSYDMLPTQITVYFVDEDNQTLQSNSTEMELTLNSEFDRNTYYSVDIKEFIDYQLSLDENNENALLLAISTTDDYGIGLDYLTVGDQESDDYEAQLSLNIINLKNE